jgi:NAD-dependent SIR2 family protein deacetylase
MEEVFINAAEIIKNSDALIIGAGAGIGVDSGLPDFRGTEGFWRAYPPIAKLGISFEEMANPFWFDKKPQLAWAFYGHRFNLYKNTIPHKGFEMLLEIAKKMKNGSFVYTSNVDGQFQKAGFDENKIYEIHGSINFLQCTKPCSNNIWKADFEKIDVNEEKFEATGDLPSCKKCGALARPNILMFGDRAWNPKRSSEQSEKYRSWIDKNKNSKLVILEFGAGTSVPSVRHNSETLVRNYNAKLIRINPREFNVPKNQIGISSGSLNAMENIFNHL